MKNKRYNGFTLVELLVVITIVAILATVSVVGYITFIEKARRSNDEQLVANINSILMADEVFTNSPVASIDIIENLEDKGFNLKTQSKGVNLFYNASTGRVELGNMEGPNYKKIFPQDVSDKKMLSKNQNIGKLKTNTTSLEHFVEGYILISKESRDTFSNIISTIRDASSVNVQQEAIEKLKKINPDVANVISSYVGVTAFIGEDNKLIDGSVLEGKMYVTFSTKTTELTNQVLESINNSNLIKIIDIPRKVTIKSDNETKLKEIIDKGKVVVASKEFVQSLANKNIAENITNVQNRKNEVKNIYIRQQNLPENKEYVFEVSKEINIPANAYHYGSSNSKYYYEIENVSLISEDGSRHQDIELSLKESGYYTYTISESDEYFADKNGDLNIKISYKQMNNPTAVVDSTKYFDVNGALLYAYTMEASNLIKIIGQDGVLTKNSSLKNNDTLLVPRKEQDNGDYARTDENNGLTTKYTNPVLYSKLTINSKLAIYGTLIIGGEQYASSSNDIGPGKLSNCYGLVEINDGFVVAENNAKLLVYGELKSTTKKLSYQVKNGATVEVLMHIPSWRGGTMTSKVVGKDLFPFNNYKLLGLKSNGDFEVGSVLSVGVALTYTDPCGGGTKLESMSVKLLSNSDESMFNLYNGKINIDSTGEKFQINVKGSVKISKFTFNAHSITFNTENMIIPLNGNFKVVVESGNLDIMATKGVKLLPGAELIVNENATLNVGSGSKSSGLYVYEWATDYTVKPAKDSTSYGYFEAYDHFGKTYTKNNFNTSAQFVNNGTLNVFNDSAFSANFTGKGLNNFSNNTKFNNTIFEINSNDKNNYGYINSHTTLDGKTKYNGSVIK